nr:lytic polysaccharide monooxygenase [uncultured microorganism]
MTPSTRSLLSILFALTSTLTPGPVFAHSHLSHIVINGALYHGYDPRNPVENPDINKTHNNPRPNYPDSVAWSYAAFDDGFVAPANYSHPDIICHISATSPKAHAPVRPGDLIHIQWNGWPVGHIGPILTYIAPCESQSGCAGVDKMMLRWTKIDESRPVLEVLPNNENLWDVEHGRAGMIGKRWATDVMIAANNSWQVMVPKGLTRGAYVMRHEIIALHFAAKRGGAQNYPVCFNLWVEGEKEGSVTLDSYDAREFYRDDHIGVWVNATAPALTSYIVPGPTMANWATPVPYAQQTSMLPRSDGTPVLVTRSTETVLWTAEVTPTTTGRAVRDKYHRNG